MGYTQTFSETRTMKRSPPTQAGESASDSISKRIAELDDWRGKTLGRIRALIKEADPDILEEWKWRGTPVWSHDGIVCTGETYKSVVKMTFAKGASLKDPSGLFNSSLDGNTRRAIDVHEGETINALALKALIVAAVALNSAGKKPAPAKKVAPSKAGASSKKTAPTKPKASSKKAAAPKASAPSKKATPSERGGR
jgi:hypothetical protein